MLASTKRQKKRTIHNIVNLQELQEYTMREREREITNYNLKPKAYTLKRGNTFSRMQ